MVFVLCSICFYLCACSLVGNLVSSLVRKLFCCFLFLFACLFTRVCQKIATNSNAIFIQVFEYYNNLQRLGGSRHWPVSWKLVLLSWTSVECKFCMSGDDGFICLKRLAYEMFVCSGKFGLRFGISHNLLSFYVFVFHLSDFCISGLLYFVLFAS